MKQRTLTVDDIKILNTPLGLKNRIIIIIYSIPILMPLKILLQNILHLELPSNAYQKKIRLGHIYNITINQKAKIGYNTTIYHNVTIGSKQFGTHIGTPKIGNNVLIYPNSCILGNINIGNNAIIGAGSIVTNDVEAFAIMAGNPAKKVASLKQG